MKRLVEVREKLSSSLDISCFKSALTFSAFNQTPDISLSPLGYKTPCKNHQVSPAFVQVTQTGYKCVNKADFISFWQSQTSCFRLFLVYAPSWVATGCSFIFTTLTWESYWSSHLPPGYGCKIKWNGAISLSPGLEILDKAFSNRAFLGAREAPVDNSHSPVVRENAYLVWTSAQITSKCFYLLQVKMKHKVIPRKFKNLNVYIITRHLPRYNIKASSMNISSLYQCHQSIGMFIPKHISQLVM